MDHTVWANPGGPGVLMNHTAWVDPKVLRPTAWVDPNVLRPTAWVDPNVPRADREWWCAECLQNAGRVRFTGLPNPP